MKTSFESVKNLHPPPGSFPENQRFKITAAALEHSDTTVEALCDELIRRISPLSGLTENDQKAFRQTYLFLKKHYKGTKHDSLLKNFRNKIPIKNNCQKGNSVTSLCQF